MTSPTAAKEVIAVLKSTIKDIQNLCNGNDTANINELIKNLKDDLIYYIKVDNDDCITTLVDKLLFVKTPGVVSGLLCNICHQRADNCIKKVWNGFNLFNHTTFTNTAGLLNEFLDNMILDMKFEISKPPYGNTDSSYVKNNRCLIGLIPEKNKIDYLGKMKDFVNNPFENEKITAISVLPAYVENKDEVKYKEYVNKFVFYIQIFAQHRKSSSGQTKNIKTQIDLLEGCINLKKDDPEYKTKFIRHSQKNSSFYRERLSSFNRMSSFDERGTK